ncbi:Potassium channel domain [Trinorchestia longiramus]|nr:Potassium channel domain [Trinorchestia longiramus]
MPPPGHRSNRGNEKDMGDSKQTRGKRIATVLLSHTVLLLIVCIYAALGAYMFMNVEEARQNLATRNKEGATRVVKSSKKYIALDMYYNSQRNLTGTKFKQLARTNLQNFHAYIVKAATNLRYDGTDEPVNDWTFSNSLLFTFTTMAAIGYGNIAPESFKGQVYCIFYGIIGVPLLLVFLASIGDFLADTFRRIYSRGCCVVCRVTRKKSEVTKEGKKPKSVFKDVVGNESYMPTEEVFVPITVNVCVLAVYLMAGGVIFMYWEGWDFHEAAYFSFITLSTIGFGDYVPGRSFDVTSDSALVSALMLAGTLTYTLLGMALLSMCINLIQEQIVSKFKWLADELGMSEESEEEIRARQKYRKTEYEVITTPAGKDGNKHLQLQNVDDSKPMRRFRRIKDDNGLQFTDVTQ